IILVPNSGTYKCDRGWWFRTFITINEGLLCLDKNYVCDLWTKRQILNCNHSRDLPCNRRIFAIGSCLLSCPAQVCDNCNNISEHKHFSTQRCREPQPLEFLSAFESNLASLKPYNDFSETEFLRCYTTVTRRCTLTRLFAVLLLISARGHSMQMTRDRSITTVTLTMLAILATPSTHVLPASTFYNQFSNTEAMVIDDIDVHSNEQQLLAYYKQARQQHLVKKQENFRYRPRDQDNSLFSDHIEVKGNRTVKINATKRSAAVKPANPYVAATNFTSTSTNTTTEKCEAKTLDEIPDEPYYDFRDIAEDAARQFTEFLANKFPSVPPAIITDQIRDEVRRRANAIASYALSEDDNLLAFALAAPSIHTVVVKFRDNVTIPPEQIRNRMDF
uniref:Uncharacterized protein n=1 Tax=Glossina pallidipes TaxID=7398 RepID=A0A1B0AH92_GLOPL